MGKMIFNKNIQNSYQSFVKPMAKFFDFETTNGQVCVHGLRKIKTRRSAFKRIKPTSKRILLRRSCGKQHLNEKKSHNRLNRLSKYQKVAIGDLKNVSKCLPYV